MKLSTVRWRLGTQSYFGNLRDPRLYATSSKGASCVLAKEFQETISIKYDLKYLVKRYFSNIFIF